MEGEKQGEGFIPMIHKKSRKNKKRSNIIVSEIGVEETSLYMGSDGKEVAEAVDSPIDDTISHILETPLIQPPIITDVAVEGDGGGNVQEAVKAASMKAKKKVSSAATEE